MVDHVNGGHREACAVGDDTDAAFEAYILESFVVGGLFSFVARLCLIELCVVRMPKYRVGVQGDFGVEHMDSVVGCEDEGVNFYEVCVAFDVGGVELHDDVDCTFDGHRVEVGTVYPYLGGFSGEADCRVDMDFADGVRVFYCDCFYFDASFCGKHPQMLFCGSVKGEAGVVLLGDVAGFFDP